MDPIKLQQNQSKPYIFLLTLLVQTLSFSVLPSIYLCLSEQTRLQIKKMDRNNRIESETTRSRRRSTIMESEISIHAVIGYDFSIIIEYFISMYRHFEQFINY